MLVQEGLFPDDGTSGRRMLPVIGEQKDIRYFGTTARSILNGPETTGMGFWSLNPYVGCAFGCAYCYARYAHRYVMERSASAVTDIRRFPPWLAFERQIVVKQNAPELVKRSLGGGSNRCRALLAGEEALVIGTATDPYQPAERRFKIT